MNRNHAFYYPGLPKYAQCKLQIQFLNSGNLKREIKLFKFLISNLINFPSKLQATYYIYVTGLQVSQKDTMSGGYVSHKEGNGAERI